MENEHALQSERCGSHYTNVLGNNIFYNNILQYYYHFRLLRHFL